MARPRVFTQSQIEEAVRLRKSGKSLNETAKIIAGNAGGGTRESLRRSLIAYGFQENPPLRSIYQPRDFSHVPEEWWAEFRGLFFGEGTVFLTKPTNGKTFLQPQMSMSLRDDDCELAQEIHRMLGGTLQAYTRREHSSPETYGHRVVNPQLRWAVVSIPNVYGIVPHLNSGILPSKKRQEFDLILEYCELRLDMPQKLSADQKELLMPYYEALRELKRYHPDC